MAETCLKTELVVHNGNLSLMGNLYTPEDMESQELEVKSTCVKGNLPATEKKCLSLAVVFTVFILGILSTCVLTLLCC
jgi:hypothetical protein